MKPVIQGELQEPFEAHDGSPRGRIPDYDEAGVDALLRRCVQEALNDPTSALPANQVFDELRAYHADCLKAAERST